MRETLKAVVDSATVIIGCLRHKRGPVFNIAKDLIVVVRAALAAPPRNCDNYDNKTDAEIGFIEETEEDDSNPLYWQLFANWLFAPAAERNGEGK